MAGEDIAPKLRELFDEETVAFVKQFFKNLGGAPAVVAITVWRDPDPFTQEIIVQSGSALMQNLLLAAEAEGLGTCWMSGVSDPGKRTAEISRAGRPAPAGHYPHRLLRQNPAGGAPQRSAGALAGVLKGCQLSENKPLASAVSGQSN